MIITVLLCLLAVVAWVGGVCMVFRHDQQTKDDGGAVVLLLVVAAVLTGDVAHRLAGLSSEGTGLSIIGAVLGFMILDTIRWQFKLRHKNRTNYQEDPFT